MTPMFMLFGDVPMTGLGWILIGAWSVAIIIGLVVSRGGEDLGVVIGGGLVLLLLLIGFYILALPIAFAMGMPNPACSAAPGTICTSPGG